MRLRARPRGPPLLPGPAGPPLIPGPVDALECPPRGPRLHAPSANQEWCGGSGVFPPGLRRRIGLYYTPYSGGGPPLLGRRTSLTRDADLPYSRGGPPLLEGRVLLTREADTPYSRGGYSLLARRTYLHPLGGPFFSAHRPSWLPAPWTQHPRGRYSLVKRRVLLSRERRILPY